LQGAFGDGESDILMLKTLIEIAKLQLEFYHRFQDFHNVESGVNMFSIPLEIDVESVPIDVQMEQWCVIMAACLQGETISRGCDPLHALEHGNFDQ